MHVRLAVVLVTWLSCGCLCFVPRPRNAVTLSVIMSFRGNAHGNVLVLAGGNVNFV